MNKKIVKFEYYPKTYLTGDEKINYNIFTTKISIEDHNKLSRRPARRSAHADR